MDSKDIWDQIEMASEAENLDEEMFEFISAYADGECSAKERRLVEAYLAQSAEARALLADLRAQSALTCQDAVEPPAWLRDSILQKTTRRRFLAGVPGFARVTAAAGAAAIAIMVIWPNSGLDQDATVFEYAPAGVAAKQDVPIAAHTTEETPGEDAPIAIQTDADVRIERRVLERVGGGQNVGPVLVAEVTQPAAPAMTTTVSGGRGSGEPQPAVTEPNVTFLGPGHSQGSRGEPAPVDTVALAGGRDESVERTSPPSRTSRGAEGEVLPDARRLLRERLERLNAEQNNDIREVINSK